MEEKSWFVYLLACGDGSLYTGVTNDLDKRMQAHASGRGSRYVSRRGFKELLCWRACASRSEALKMEWIVKGLKRSEKVAWFLS